MLFANGWNYSLFKLLQNFKKCPTHSFRFNKLTKKNGPRPWWWMGKKCLPIHRKWITGRDVNDAFDLPFHDLWAKKFY